MHRRGGTLKAEFMRRLFYLTIILTIGLIGCNGSGDPLGLVPDHVNKFAINFIDQVHDGNIDTCLTMVSNDMKDTNGRGFLNDLHNSIKYSRLDSCRIINSSKTSVYGGDKYDIYKIEYEYFVDSRFQYYNFSIKEKPDSLIILGFKAGQFETTLADQNAFTLKGKGFIHFFFLIFCILIPTFCIITIIFAFKSKIKLRWLWIIGIAVGLMRFSLNWTTGEFDYQLTNASFLGAGFVKYGIEGQWIFFISVPLFAIIFWFRRKTLIKNYYEHIEQLEKERLAEQIADAGYSNLESDPITQQEENRQETPAEVITRLRSRQDTASIDFNILEACSPSKILKFDRLLTNIKPGEKICYHDNQIKLVDSERWQGLVESGNSEMFKIIYSFQ
jgi:hypothetical protein